MALYNILSVTLFFIAYTLNRKTHHSLAFSIIAAEVCLHASLATYIIGWPSGFFVYLLAMVPLAFFNPAWNHRIKIFLSVFFTLLFISLKIYSDSHTPLISLSTHHLNFSYYINGTFIFFLLAYLSYFYSLATTQAESALQKSFDQIQIQARTDPLTKLSNRRGITEAIEKEISRFNRNNAKFSIIMADIDNFKHVNDYYGHDCGDFVLARLADIISSMLRENDRVGRWGGEEFLILLPDTEHNEAYLVAEKIRLALYDKIFQFRDLDCQITMTFGINVYTGQESITSCINNADKNLYKGKRSGKNRVITTSS